MAKGLRLFGREFEGQRLTDSNGAIVAAVEVGPFGWETNRSWDNSNVQQKRQYTTYDRDANGSDEAMMRRYNRWNDRFDQSDPYDGSMSLADPQSLNRYAYVQNDPVNFVDPTGLFASTFCDASWSYEQCGGDNGFWGGGFFGGDYAGWFQEYGGMPEIAANALRLYNQRVTNTIAGYGFLTSAELVVRWLGANATLCRSAEDCWAAGGEQAMTLLTIFFEAA